MSAHGDVQGNSDRRSGSGGAGADWQRDLLQDIGERRAEPAPGAGASYAGDPYAGSPYGSAGADAAAAQSAAQGPSAAQPSPSGQWQSYGAQPQAQPLPQAQPQPRDAQSGQQPSPSGQPHPHTAQPSPGQPHPHTAQPGHQPHPHNSPHPTPVSSPVVDPALAAAEGRPVQGETLARRAGRALWRLVSATAGDTAAVTEAARAIQQPITTGRQIAVTSIRGGSGKSTVAALLALTYAHYRADPVLAVEADPSLGTLPRRLGATEVRWSCADLARIVDPSMQITDLTGYLVPFDGGWLLPGSQGTVGAQLGVDTYRTVMTSVRRYFGTTVVDCETLPAEVARTALSTTQARVLTAPATVEGVAATRSVLDWMGGLHRSMLPTTVVALCHTAPDSSLDVRAAARHLEESGAQVSFVPYDRHLAAGGPVRTELLAQATREAAARLAAAAMDRAVSRERREPPR